MPRLATVRSVENASTGTPRSFAMGVTAVTETRQTAWPNNHFCPLRQQFARGIRGIVRRSTLIGGHEDEVGIIRIRHRKLGRLKHRVCKRARGG